MNSVVLHMNSTKFEINLTESFLIKIIYILKNSQKED